MSDPKPRARERPVLPDPPFLCGDCRHGRVIAQKLQPWLLGAESWQDQGPGWFWQARCRSAKVAPWKFTIFCHPVVDCDAFRARKLLTTEDHDRRRDARARKRRKKQKKGC